MKTHPKHYDVVVVGGGASGMMAAGRAAELGKSVLLLEKNPKPGAKLDISGGGRCNITNAEEDIHTLLGHYGAAEQFLYSPFAKFSNKDAVEFFESHGLPIVVEARKRAFPKSQHAPDVTRTLIAYMKKGGVKVITGVSARKFHSADGAVTSLQASDGMRYEGNTFIIATGGYSHPETGSTGDGFRWLSELGHTIKRSSPTLVPIEVGDNWVKKLSGVSLSFMKITFFVDKVKAFAKTGKILFTHFGLSGPLILNSAQKVADLLHAGQVTATIDMYPDTDHGALERQILATLEKNKNKDLKNILDLVVPHGLDATVLWLLRLKDPNIKVHSFSKEDRKRLVHLLKAMPVTIKGLMGYDRAVISDGGVPLEEVDMRTMRSKKCGNLFVTGDILNINRPSGGYSLQLAWTTGWIAGSNA